MDRIWLKHYPPGVPADIDAGQYPSVVALFEESFAKYKNDNAYACMDKKLTYGQVDEMSRALGCLAAEQGAAARGSRRDHDAERAAVSRVRRRHPARGLRGRERQPALHAPRTRAPAQGFRREGHHHHRELRQDAGAGHRPGHREACGAREHGRPAGFPQGRDRQSCRAQGEEDGAGVLAARRNEVQRRDRRRPAHEPRPGPTSSATMSPSCSTPAARRAFPRAPRCCTATSSPTCCRTKRGCNRRSRRASRSIA